MYYTLWLQLTRLEKSYFFESLVTQYVYIACVQKSIFRNWHKKLWSKYKNSEMQSYPQRGNCLPEPSWEYIRPLPSGSLLPINIIFNEVITIVFICGIYGYRMRIISTPWTSTINVLFNIRLALSSIWIDETASSILEGVWSINDIVFLRCLARQYLFCLRKYYNYLK